VADKHPYFQSPGSFTQLVTHLRRKFPATVNAETLKKLGIAPKNESYHVNTLRFLGLLDDDGNKTDLAATVFNQHRDEDFQSEFAKVLESAYGDLFALHGDGTWDLDRDQLITFFRQADQSSASVGGYQAGAFKCMAALAGHGDVPEPKPAKTTTSRPKPKNKAATKKPAVQTAVTQPATEPVEPARITSRSQDVGLTVRIEINLPAEGDQETYDRIFKSIREHFIDG
jgi:hypothetical protein